MLVSTRSCSETSSGSTTSVTRSLVRIPHIISLPQLTLEVASKCGFDVFGKGGITNSAAHIKEYIEGTIERLGFAPDLYYLHRIDPSTLVSARIPFTEYS